MFLALSKILSLLIYPLSLVILLLTIGLVVLVRSQRRLIQRGAIASIILAVVLLWGSSNYAVSNFFVRSLEFQNIPTGDLPTTQAIVVLGGGTKPMISPRPWVEVAEAGDRILYGSRLLLQGKAPLLIVSGGRAEWMGEGGNPESEDMAIFAQALQVPASVIIQDPTSLTTYENAVNVKQIMQQRQIQKILLVTSALHMPRSLAIFRKLSIDAIAAPTDFLTVNNTNDKGFLGLLFGLLPDADALKNTTNALKEYIGLFVYRLRGWA